MQEDVVFGLFCLVKKRGAFKNAKNGEVTPKNNLCATPTRSTGHLGPHALPNL